MRVKLELEYGEILHCSDCEQTSTDGDTVYLTIVDMNVKWVNCAACIAREAAELRRDDGEDR